MTDPRPKRFYKIAAAERLGDGWTVALDGRSDERRDHDPALRP
jgi:chaperone required for assembly of F1-ATPase